MFKIIVVMVSCLLLLSCSNALREDSANQLNNNIETVAQQNIKFVDSKIFFQLLDTLPDNAMRREGVQNINSLTLKYPQSKKLPFNEVVILFDALIENNPLQAHDKILFELSKVYEAIGENKAALMALNKIISLYPSLNYLDEVQFRKANMLYAQKQFLEAEKTYKQVISFRRSSYYERAVYQQGRSQFMQTRYDAALNSYMHLLDVHSRDGDLVFKRMGKAEAVFIEKVMQAINQSFDAMAGPLSARDYFSSKQKRKYEYPVFLSLSKYYQQLNQLSNAVKTYRLFVGINELHIQSPALLLEVMSLYKKAGLNNEFLAAQKDFVLRYSINHVYWRLHPKNKTSKYFKALNENIEQLANRYYFLSKHTNQSSDYRQSQHWNRLFLYSFADDIAARNARLQLAESLQGNRQFELAALQYESVAYDYKNHSSSARSAYSALLMYEKNGEELSGFEKKYAHNLYMDSVHRFVATFPEYAETKNVRPKLMQSQYVNSHYDNAFKLFGQRKWQQAAVAFEALRGNLPQLKLQKEITKKLALSYWQTAQYEKAINEFQKISYYIDANNRQHEMLWMAAELSELNNNVKQAIKLYGSYVNRFAFPLHQSIEAQQRLIEIYDRTEKPLLATKWRVKLVNADANGGTFRTQRTRHLAAQARFVLAELLDENYRKTSLKTPLNESLKIKIKLLSDATSAYKIAASYKVAQVLTAATYRIAELNENFYQLILNSARPTNLNESEKKQYDVLLNKKAQSFNDKAIYFHQVNVSRKADGLNDAWILKSAERLEVLNASY